MLCYVVNINMLYFYKAYFANHHFFYSMIYLRYKYKSNINYTINILSIFNDTIK